MKSANPYLNFAGNALEAFEFYRSVFGGEFLSVVRYRDFPNNAMGVPEKELDRIAHITLPIGNSLLMATDLIESWGPLTIGNNSYITVETDTADEAERVFEQLAAGGRSDMPLQQTEWAEKYGQCVDRYGVAWMVMYTGNVQFQPAGAAAGSEAASR